MRPDRFLHSRLSTRWQALWSRLSRTLALDAWFPHVPLGLAVGLLGAVHLLPPLIRALGLRFYSQTLTTLTLNLVNVGLAGLPQIGVGLFLLSMSFGLLLRSRLAWVTTVLSLGAGIVLLLLQPGDHLHDWLLPYSVALLLGLLASFPYFDRSSLATATLFAVTCLTVLIGYGVIGSYLLGDLFQPPIDSLEQALYFTVETLSTVGYGDIVAQTPQARLFLVSLIGAGMVAVATIFGAILVPLISRQLETLFHGRKAMNRKDHYIIVGASALAYNTFQELCRRGEKITFILRREPEGPPFSELDVVVGDASDLDVLRQAGGEQAKAILALTDDDSENAFIVLAAKELGKVRTIAAVNDARNLKRLRRVRPNLVIAPPVLGGELLAMALSGETIDSKRLMQLLMGSV